MSIVPAKLHHVSRQTQKLDETRRFYVDVLGFRELSSRPNFPFRGAWLYGSGIQIHLIDEPYHETAGPPNPRENHIAQLQCYYTLLDQYGIPVNRLVLVYVDDQTIVPKLVPLGSRKQWMIERATALHLGLETSEIPEPEVGPGCVYCPFIKTCPRSDEAVRIKEGKNVRRQSA